MMAAHHSVSALSRWAVIRSDSRTSAVAISAREDLARLVHELLAAIGVHDGERFVASPGAGEVDGLLQLRHLVVQDREQAFDFGAIDPVDPGDGLQACDAPIKLCRGLLIRLQIARGAGQQIAALAGLGVLHRGEQIDGGAAQFARLRRFLHIGLGAVHQPDRGADDRDEGDEARQQQQQRCLDEGQARDRHWPPQRCSALHDTTRWCGESTGPALVFGAVSAEVRQWPLDAELDAFELGLEVADGGRHARFHLLDETPQRDHAARQCSWPRYARDSPRDRGRSPRTIERARSPFSALSAPIMVQQCAAR